MFTLIFGFILKVNTRILCYFYLSNLNLQIINTVILYDPFASNLIYFMIGFFILWFYFEVMKEYTQVRQ